MEMRSVRSAWRIALVCGALVVVYNLFNHYDFDQGELVSVRLMSKLHLWISRIKTGIQLTRGR